MAGPTKFFAFGFSGIDQEVNQHIQTNLVFAIADAKQEWMAWYIYFQRLLLGRWENEFIAAGSDYPGKHTYTEALFFIRETLELSATEKTFLLGGTVRRLLGWPS